MLDAVNKQAVAKALDLANKIEGTNDPLLQHGVDALRGLVDANEQDKYDNENRNRE